MNTIIEGLLTQKPENDPPEIGQTKCFTLEQRTSKKGKPWTKIKNSFPDKGGSPYRIIAANQTDFVDAHGNLSFNLQIEPAVGQQTTQAATQSTQDAHEPASDPILETRQHLMRACNLYNLCVDAVNSAIVPHLPEGARMSPEQLQSTLASIWIEASSRRSTNGVDWWSFIDKMPVAPIKKQTKAQPKHEEHDDEPLPF